MFLSQPSKLDSALAGSSMNDSTPSLPNPLTPMAFLPPALAFYLTVEVYIAVAALAIMVWDILDTIGTDYIFLTKHKIKLPTIVYFISRLSTFGSLLVLTIFASAPIGSCERVAHAIMWLFNIAIPSTSLLLFFRVQALYRNNKFVVGLFVIMLAGVTCAGAVSMANPSGITIGPTQYCIDATVPQTPYIFGVCLLINDTLTLLATSWRLRGITLEQNSTFLQNLRTMFLGSSLPNFSKSLLQDGQKYYLTTVGFSLFATITLSLDVVPLPLRGVVGILDVMLLNIMACRVFRKTKLGLYWEGQDTIPSRVVHQIDVRTARMTDSIPKPEEHTLQTISFADHQSD